MTASLPNLLILQRYWLRAISVDLGRSLQAWSDLVDGMSIA